MRDIEYITDHPVNLWDKSVMIMTGFDFNREYFNLE